MVKRTSENVSAHPVFLSDGAPLKPPRVDSTINVRGVTLLQNNASELDFRTEPYFFCTHQSRNNALQDITNLEILSTTDLYKGLCEELMPQFLELKTRTSSSKNYLNVYSTAFVVKKNAHCDKSWFSKPSPKCVF